MKPLLAVLILLCSAAAIAPAATTTTKAAGATPVAAKAADMDSLALLENAVAKDSSKVDNLYRLGVMYLDRDRPAEAITVLGKAYEKRPKDLRLLVNLGAAHDAYGHGDVAQRLYREALAVAPGDSVASCRLASSLYASRKHQEAIDLLRSVIQRAPGSYCAYFTLGVAFADAGIYRDAIRMWQKVVDLAPGSPEAVSAEESITVLQKFVK
ncbi:MAG: tetratricopeptide repeat protein [Candidatus Eiseniibacteriota bacterium]